MKSPTYHEHHNRVLFSLITLWIILLLFASLLYLFGPPLLPLWYSLVVPEEQLAIREYVFIFPGVGASIVLLSLWFGRKSDLEHEEYLATLSLWGGCVLLFLLLVSLLRIIKVVL